MRNEVGHSESDKEYRFKEPTPEELAALKVRIANKRNRRDLLLRIGILTVLSGLEIWLLVYIT